MVKCHQSKGLELKKLEIQGQRADTLAETMLQALQNYVNKKIFKTKDEKVSD